jgi:hypothetical protein
MGTGLGVSLIDEGGVDSGAISAIAALVPATLYSEIERPKDGLQSHEKEQST